MNARVALLPLCLLPIACDAPLDEEAPRVNELMSPIAGEWPTFKRDLQHSGVATDMAGAITAENRCQRFPPVALAASCTRGASGALIATVSGVPTVFFVTDSTPGDCTGPGAAYALDGRDGSELWRLDLPGETQSDPYAPTLADVDLDGARELLFASNNSGEVFAVRTEDEADGEAGTIQWTGRFPAGVRSEGAPVVAHLDPEDPEPEVIVGSDASWVEGAEGAAVLVFAGADGEVKGEGFVAPSRAGLMHDCAGGNKIDSSSPSIADVDGLKVFVGAWNGRFYALEWQSEPPALVEAWSDVLPPYEHGPCTLRKVRSGAVVADLIPGGDLEVAYGVMAESEGLEQYETARLRIVSARDGALIDELEVWDWKSTPSAADLDPHAPGLELTGGRYRGFYAARRDDAGAFTVAWNPERGDGNEGWGGNRTSPAVADLDGDGDLEIVMGVEGAVDTGLWVLDGQSGEVEWSLLMPGTGGVDSSPAVGDVDGDGQLEIAFLGRDGLAYVVDSSCP